MPRILVTPIELVRGEGPCQDTLRSAGFEIVYPPVGVTLYDADRLAAHLPGIDGMLAGMEPLNRRVIEGSNLRAISRMGVGYDAVDVKAASERNVAVAVAVGTNHVCVAEHMLALLLGVMRGFPARDRAVRAGSWQRKLLGRLDGKTIGLVGLGRIGKAVVPRVQALGMTVIAHDPMADDSWAKANGVQLVPLAELLAKCDVLSLHAPCTAENTKMINAQTLATMKRGAVLINTARGGLVDEDALCDALRSGQLSAAGLDAFVVEPLPTTSPLLDLDNVLLSPHVAGIDEQSVADMGRVAAENLVHLFQGRYPQECIVNKQLWPGWKW